LTLSLACSLSLFLSPSLSISLSLTLFFSFSRESNRDTTALSALLSLFLHFFQVRFFSLKLNINFFEKKIYLFQIYLLLNDNFFANLHHALSLVVHLLLTLV